MWGDKDERGVGKERYKVLVLTVNGCFSLNQRCIKTQGESANAQNQDVPPSKSYLSLL